MADDTLDQIREKFSHDRFATEACGCRVDEARAGHAVCSLDLTPKHINEKGVPMGGAIFTLADFAIAVASNLGRALRSRFRAASSFSASQRGTA